MAKSNGKYIKLASLAVVVIVIVAGVIGGYAVNADDIGEIKVEGCLPSRKNNEAIIRLQSDIGHIKEDTAAIRKILEK